MWTVNVMVVFICLFLRIKGIVYFFMCLLITGVSFFGKICIQIFCSFQELGGLCFYYCILGVLCIPDKVVSVAFLWIEPSGQNGRGFLLKSALMAPFTLPYLLPQSSLSTFWPGSSSSVLLHSLPLVICENTLPSWLFLILRCQPQSSEEPSLMDPDHNQMLPLGDLIVPVLAHGRVYHTSWMVLILFVWGC